MHSDSMMLGNQAEFPRQLGIKSALRLYHNGGEVRVCTPRCVRAHMGAGTHIHTPLYAAHLEKQK